ncbi:MAG: hypothetical protein M1832_000370 [Thelocarpon impressellum]|nr:MAG: hypothetical protein M1832_000370 [Thelocarpon impressellum]
MIVAYWVFPLLSACAWLGMLLALFIAWQVQGTPNYRSMQPEQRVAYISDVGATNLKPLFNVGCVLTSVFLDLAFVAERWLRHKGLLARNVATSEKVLAGLSIAFAVVGTVGLICLSFFDTVNYMSLHRLFLLLFMGGYVISAVFTCWEYQRLGAHYRDMRNLRMSFWIKLAFILVEFVLSIAFGTMLYKRRQNIGAVLEWVISLIFTFYILTFLVDLLPAVRRHHEIKHGHASDAEKGAAVNGRVHEPGHTHANGHANGAGV